MQDEPLNETELREIIENQRKAMKEAHELIHMGRPVLAKGVLERALT